MRRLLIIMLALAVALATLPHILVDFSETKVHFSIDDSDECFAELVRDSCSKESLFDYPHWSYYKSLHNRYGCKITLYAYEESVENVLQGRVNRYKSDFCNNVDWLKFGFHSSMADDPRNGSQDWPAAYDKFNEDVEEFAGEESISNILRLSYFYAKPQDVAYIASKGGLTLLSADDDRISYDLTFDEDSALKASETFTKNGVTYKVTDFRTERISCPLLTLLRNNKEDDLIFFTHEWALDSENKKNIERIMKFLKNEKAEWIN